MHPRQQPTAPAAATRTGRSRRGRRRENRHPRRGRQIGTDQRPAAEAKAAAKHAQASEDKEWLRDVAQ